MIPALLFLAMSFNGLSNGDFKDSLEPDPRTAQLLVEPGSCAIHNWQVTQGPVILVRQADGRKAVHLSQGCLQQVLATLPGSRYRLSFQVFSRAQDDSLMVSAGDQLFLLPPSGTGCTLTCTFRAHESLTRLSLRARQPRPYTLTVMKVDMNAL